MFHLMFVFVCCKTAQNPVILTLEVKSWPVVPWFRIKRKILKTRIKRKENDGFATEWLLNGQWRTIALK